MKTFLLSCILTIGLLATACGNESSVNNQKTSDSAPSAAETTTPPATKDGVAISLISPDPKAVPMGDTELILEVTNSETREPMKIEDLKVDLTMDMGEMEPMTAMALVEPDAQPGQYRIVTNLGMAGMWMMEVESADPTMPGKATFDLEVK